MPVPVLWHPLLLASTPQPKSPAVNHVPSRVTVCAHVPSRMRHRGLSCCVRTHTHPFHHACISPLAVALLPHVSFRNTALTTTKATFDELMLHIKAADEILVNLGMTQNLDLTCQAFIWDHLMNEFQPQRPRFETGD